MNCGSSEPSLTSALQQVGNSRQGCSSPGRKKCRAFRVKGSQYSSITHDLPAPFAKGRGPVPAVLEVDTLSRCRVRYVATPSRSSPGRHCPSATVPDSGLRTRGSQRERLARPRPDRRPSATGGRSACRCGMFAADSYERQARPTHMPPFPQTRPRRCRFAALSPSTGPRAWTSGVRPVCP